MNIKYILEGILMRWAEFLIVNDFKIFYSPGFINFIAHYLSRYLYKLAIGLLVSQVLSKEKSILNKKILFRLSLKKG